MKNGAAYILFYSTSVFGFSGNDKAIATAVSGDGSSFTKDNDNPVMSINDGLAWRDNRTYTPWVIRDTDRWRMYYTGRSAAGAYYIGTAINFGVP
ncbi:MAG: hypothetical protein JXD23_00725 [Spirochaetales bacterium]|nr:hypothetical protein [Spirochaetales bacterium]